MQWLNNQFIIIEIAYKLLRSGRLSTSAMPVLNHFSHCKLIMLIYNSISDENIICVIRLKRKKCTTVMTEAIRPLIIMIVIKGLFLGAISNYLSQWLTGTNSSLLFSEATNSSSNFMKWLNFWLQTDISIWDSIYFGSPLKHVVFITFFF